MQDGALARESFVPPRRFRELRQLSRYRRKLMGDRSRLRNRGQRVLDRAGLRVGGALSDVFGRNGRMLLDGLAAGRSSADMLGALTGHVQQAKKQQLEQALQSQFQAEGRRLLQQQLRDHDRLMAQIAELDAEMAAGLAAYEPQLSLLDTLPGVVRASARALLLEIGPAPAAHFPTVEHLAAWAGLAPGNHASAGKRCCGRSTPCCAMASAMSIPKPTTKSCWCSAIGRAGCA